MKKLISYARSIFLWGFWSTRCERPARDGLAELVVRKPGSGWFFVLGGLAALRLWHLDADAPPWLTWSTDLFTDEGWYARESILLARGEPWHAPGEFAILPSLPVAPLLLAGWFRLVGVGLVEARLLAVLASFVLTASVYRIAAVAVSRRSAPWAALATLAIYVVAGYARLWFFDVVALALAALAVALVVEPPGPPRTPHLARWLAAGIVVAAGVLTKTTVAFVLGTLVLLALRQGGWRRAVPAWAVLLAPVLLVVGAHQLWLRRSYTLENRYFVHVNVVERAVGSAGDVFLACAEAIGVGHFVLGACAVPMILLVVRVRRRRALWGQQGVLIALSWWAGHGAVMCTTTYHPPRYFLYWIVPAALLLGLAAAHPHRLFRGRLARVIRAMVVFALFVEGTRTVVGVAQPSYSLVRTARNIAARVHEADPEAVLVGSMADLVALVAPVEAVNDQYGLRPLPARIAAEGGARRLVAFGEMSEPVEEALAPRYSWTRVTEYDVLRRYRGFPVVLYTLTPRVAGEREASLRQSRPPGFGMEAR